MLPPNTKKPRLSPLNPAPPLDRLGTYIQSAIQLFQESQSWHDFITKLRGPMDLHAHLQTTMPHPAAPLLHRIAVNGVPVLQTTPPWTLNTKDAAVARGSHPSTLTKIHFLREEMADMIDQNFWTIIPYKYIRYLPYLRISPMGVIPQRDRRERVIVDYSFSNVNLDTVPVAPSESMQFGNALERLLYKMHHANRRFGPVFMIKIDLADGFYRLPIASSFIPTLAVVFSPPPP